MIQLSEVPSCRLPCSRRPVPSAAPLSLHPCVRQPHRTPEGLSRSRHLCIALAAAFSLAVPVGAQEASSTSDTLLAVRLVAGRVASIKVDGLMHEAAWRTAPTLGPLRQREPLEGAPATEQTEVRILYDEATLYVGVLARDAHPEQVVARLLARDKVMETEFDGKPRFGGDDGIALLIDPFHDHRNAFVFATNPNGAEFEALIADEGRAFNIDWRGVWQVAAKRVPEGWSAEFAIPFRTLRYPANPATWGFNVYRMIRRKNEEALWQSWSRDNAGFARVSQAGHLEGLTRLPRPGLNADVKPYVLGGADVTRPDGGAVQQGVGNVGLDLKSEVRPGLVLDLTANTDFAQVEVDDQQVNLTRFSLFFPEKRDFFLENAGIFEFGQRGSFEPPPFQLFFSRSIGIDPDSGAIPMLGGARLSGRVGRQTLGFMSAATGAKYLEPRTLFNVARVKRDVGGANYVGAMLVDRRNDRTTNTAGGADFSFWPRNALNVQGFVARTGTSGSGGDDLTYRVGTDYQTNRLGVTTSHLYIGPEVNAAAGFVPRVDIHRTQSNWRFTQRPSALNLRRINYNFWFDQVADAQWRRLDWSVTTGIRPIWNTEDGFGLFATVGRNRITEAFSLADTVPVPAGDYLYRTLSLFGSTGRSRAVILDVMGDLQEMFGGRINKVTTTVTTAVGAHLALRTSYTVSHADLPNGAFDVHLVSLRANWTFTTRVALNSLVQYNSLARTVSANVRLNVIHRPGSDIFLVVNEERGSELSAWDPSNRAVRVKVTYLARF